MSTLEAKLEAKHIKRRLTREEFLALSLSELYNLVADDMEQVFARPGHHFRYSSWASFGEYRGGERFCYACAAGAVAIAEFGVVSNEEWDGIERDPEVWGRCRLISAQGAELLKEQQRQQSVLRSREEFDLAQRDVLIKGFREKATQLAQGVLKWPI